MLRNCSLTINIRFELKINAKKVGDFKPIAYICIVR